MVTAIAGGSVTTGSTATVDAPVQTQILVPQGVSGDVTIDTTATTTPAPTGFVLFGSEFVITAPTATASSPYNVTFIVDASLVGATAVADIAVFRNGAALTPCTDQYAAVPDPCTSGAELSGGDAYVHVRTSQFSTWSLGKLSYHLTGPFAPVDPLPTVNTTKSGASVPVKFRLGGDKGLNVFAPGYPKVVSGSCAGTTIDEVEVTAPAGALAFSYEPTTDTYTYVWKTVKGNVGCQQLVLRFRDDSEFRALFNLR